MVTAEQVWAALDEIPDPEIPVVSLVDLGVIRSVDVSNGHVRVELTPTFLGCPALEAMVSAIQANVPDAEVDVVNDDSWSTDKITAAGREKLRGGQHEAKGSRKHQAQGERLKGMPAARGVLPLIWGYPKPLKRGTPARSAARSL